MDNQSHDIFGNVDIFSVKLSVESTFCSLIISNTSEIHEKSKFPVHGKVMKKIRVPSTGKKNEKIIKVLSTGKNLKKSKSPVQGKT